MSAWSTAVKAIRRCLAAGVAEFVVCGGARNAALVEALARFEAAGAIRLWRHFEERSAAFFALGRTLETGAPCAVVTTSGTAAAELLPAVIEAFYQGRPLVALTADRPARFRGSGAPQAINQTAIFGPHAFTGPPDEWTGRIPLHCNVELEENFEPDGADFTGELPAAFTPEADRLDVSGLARWLREDPSAGIAVLVGGLDPSEREEVYYFCRDLGAPLHAEATSGLREALAPLAIHDADRALARNPPGRILRIGDVPSGRFWRDLESLKDSQVFSICRNGLPGLARTSRVITGRADRVLRALGTAEPADDPLDLLTGAAARATRIEELLEAHPDSEPGLVRALSHYACIGEGVFLGNSLPIREWNLFAQWIRPVTDVRANRGANGIDGQTGTWLGWCADKPGRWALLGDLTALYDAAAPFVLDQLPAGDRVLAVIDNGGGGIFRRLPRLATMHPTAAACLTAPHQADLSGLARLWGMRHLAVKSADDLDALTPGHGPLLLVLHPDPRQTTAFWNHWDRLTP